jgi:hypothetical protein
MSWMPNTRRQRVSHGGRIGAIRQHCQRRRTGVQRRAGAGNVGQVRPVGIAPHGPQAIEQRGIDDAVAAGIDDRLPRWRLSATRLQFGQPTLATGGDMQSDHRNAADPFQHLGRGRVTRVDFDRPEMASVLHAVDSEQSNQPQGCNRVSQPQVHPLRFRP